MPAPKVGDKVKVVNFHNKTRIGEMGKVVEVYNDWKLLSDSYVEKYPRLERELRYKVELDDGVILHKLIAEELKVVTPGYRESI